MSTFNKFLKLTEKHIAPETYDIQKNWQKLGSRFRFIPFDDYKSRQVGKPDFKTSNMTGIEVEQWFTGVASQCDGRLQAKILKGFDKYGDKYKQSGDNMETYKGWIVDAMVRCGFMVEGVIKLDEAKMYKAKDIIDAWKDAYGEDIMNSDHADVPNDIDNDYRGRVTIKDLEEIFDDRYGEELSPEFLEALGESVVNESEAERILQDLLDERGGDMGQLHGMEMEDALDTVEAYGHKGSKAKKIAKELFSLCNESVVTEAKNLKDMSDIDLIATLDHLKTGPANIRDVSDTLIKRIEKEIKKRGIKESVVNEKDDAGDHLDNLESIVGKARDFFAIGKELDKGGYKKKYFYSDTMAPTYTIEVDGFRFAIINKRYVDKGDREVGDIAIGLLENMEINEGKKVTLKRRYTENHPAITAGQHAKIRNKILEAIGDGQITQEEFDAILKELSNDKGRWSRRNAKYFNVSEEGISLSKFGKRILKSITVNENKENKPMKKPFLFESFGKFIDANFLNEAFKSMRFAELFTQTSRYADKKKLNKELIKAFYNSTKINIAKIEDEDILTIDAQTAYKNKAADTIVFYISDNPKENPYAPYDAYSSNKEIPGGGYLLAMATGKNEFYGVEWSRYSGGRTLSKRDNNPSDSVGISKKYKGWDATGLYNVKRIAEVADRAVVLNIALLKQKYSTAEIRASREEARKGATAFKSDKDFRDENRNRYHQILATKAAALPLDKMVEEAIEKLAKQISDGLKAGERTQYNEIKIGVSPKGREVKAKDASSHMSSILDDYSRYCDYIRQAEESEARYGERESFYERESKNYAKSIKERIAKIDTFDYAW